MEGIEGDQLASGSSSGSELQDSREETGVPIFCGTDSYLIIVETNEDMPVSKELVGRRKIMGVSMSERKRVNGGVFVRGLLFDRH